MISVVIPSFSRPLNLEQALESVRSHSKFSNEIIIMSPDPDENYLSLGKKYDAVVVNDHSRQNGRRVKSLWHVLNSGIETAREPYVCWLNDDCTVLDDWDVHALNAFRQKDCAIVVLRTQHVGYRPDFVVIKTLYHVPCANYGVIRKADGLRFDEKFSWFHGDADIALQAEFNLRKRVCETTEPCVIHKHVMDSVRSGNELDERTRQDWAYLNTKWLNYSKVGPLRLHAASARAANLISFLASRARRLVEKLIELRKGRTT